MSLLLLDPERAYPSQFGELGFVRVKHIFSRKLKIYLENRSFRLPEYHGVRKSVGS